MAGRFSRDTTVTAVGDGRYEANIDCGWWVERGPNGGYVGALVERALEHAVGDAERRLRSFTVHYLAPPAEGPVEVLTTVERAGRSLTSVSARLMQGSRALAIAVGAFSSSRPSVEFCDLVMPDVPPPEALEAGRPGGGPPPIPMTERYEMRWAIGGLPFSGTDEAVAGGWIRFAEPEVVDAAAMVALSDAWLPPLFTRVSRFLAVPTVDLTVHVRGPAPDGYDDWCLVVFRSSMAADGFVEEDGQIWTRDGTLLAQSRQLAVMLPVG